MNDPAITTEVKVALLKLEYSKSERQKIELRRVLQRVLDTPDVVDDELRLKIREALGLK